MNKDSIKQKIFVIGDSHSFFWSGQNDVQRQYFDFGIHTELVSHPRFTIFHLGPCLAYNINRYGTKTQAREKVDFLLKYHIPPKACIMTSFGEIDIRVHVFKYGHTQAEKRIYAILEEYLSFLYFLHTSGYRPICYAPIASQKDDWVLNPDFPRHGSEQDRNRATCFFAAKLREACAEHAFPFISLLDIMLDAMGNTHANVIFDQCHASPQLFPVAVDRLDQILTHYL